MVALVGTAHGVAGAVGVQTALALERERRGSRFRRNMLDRT